MVSPAPSQNPDSFSQTPTSQVEASDDYYTQKAKIEADREQSKHEAEEEATHSMHRLFMPATEGLPEADIALLDRVNDIIVAEDL